MITLKLTPTDLVEIRATPLGPWKGHAVARPLHWQSVRQMGAPTLVGTHHAPAPTNGPSRVRIEARRPGQLNISRCRPAPAASTPLGRPRQWCGEKVPTRSKHYCAQRGRQQRCGEHAIDAVGDALGLPALAHLAHELLSLALDPVFSELVAQPTELVQQAAQVLQFGLPVSPARCRDVLVSQESLELIPQRRQPLIQKIIKSSWRS